jgi:hypothetical protein
VEGREFAGQHALAEPAVSCPQNRAAIGAEPHGDAEPWRPHVPRVQRSPAADKVVGFAALEIDRAQVLADGATVIEPNADIDGEPSPHRQGVAPERGGRDELAARVGRGARDGLKGNHRCDEPHPGRDDGGEWCSPFDLPPVFRS